uniref:TraA n=1 Tax=Pyxidicoccus fallax TaxID=394095 RepID=A0A410RA80_9BACT|nr:TraA [Pyxidicoccus fallax]
MLDDVRPLKAPLFRIARTALTMLSVCLAGVAGAAKLPAVVVSGPPVAPSPNELGTGLCIASKSTTTPLNDFPLTEATFINGLNTFMSTVEEGSANQCTGTYCTSVLRSRFDLSNNHTSGTDSRSYGDFLNAEPGCTGGGCAFYFNDSSTSFAARLRGFLNVTPDLVGRPLHLGFYADDAVSLVIYDQGGREYQVINRPPQVGDSTWRTTNTVTFTRSGLYPVEVLYANFYLHAALEFSLFTREESFTDFERLVQGNAIDNLSSAGFTIVPVERFFQADNGQPSFPTDLNRCEQCNRRFAGFPGNGGCDPFYHCNAAALCAPCNSSLLCGESCSPCGQSTPHCANLNGRTQCVQCTEDSQCPNGRCDLTDNICRGCNDDADCPDNGRCDTTTNQCTGCNDDSDCPGGACDEPTATCVQCTDDTHCRNNQVCATDTNTCVECNDDSQCPRGEVCTNNQCSPCNTNDACAGNSCNCCPNGTQCAALTPGASPSCVECTTDSQCAEGQQCDPLNGRCVDALPECNTSDQCGPSCAKCPGERPYCLDGQVCVQCRTDLECGDGQFCLSGECSSCTTDRHCGERCGACEGDTPFCLSDGSVQGSACVGCRNDSDCGSGQCNPETRTCENAGACAVTCDAGLVCDGVSCVECFADAHCPCGGTCDVATNTCSVSCDDSGDCLGVQHCSAATQSCERGRRKPGTEPQGGAFCCGTTADATPAGSTTVLVLLAAGLLLLRSQRRAR